MAIYFLFGGEGHKEHGGMGDYLGAFNSLEEAEDAHGPVDWGQIATVRDGQLIVIEEIKLVDAVWTWVSKE